MFTAANDNAPPRARPVLLVGTVGEDGAVSITDPDFWARSLAEPIAWPNDYREA